MKKLSTFLCVLIFHLFPSYAQADTDTSQNRLQKIADDYLKNYGAEEYISAVSLAVKTPEMKKLLTIESGYTEMTQEHLVKASNLYQIGSITKSFLSVILLQLEAEGKLSIDDPIGKYWPDCPVQWAGVSVKQLLSMTSGIPTYTDDSIYNDITQNPQRQFYTDDLIAYVKDKPLMFLPGSAWFYSNTDYIIAEKMIEYITHENLHDVLQQRIFTPWHLHHTYYIPDSYPFYPVYVYAHMVNGYANQQEDAQYWPLKTNITLWTLSWARGAGAIIANTSDLTKWVETLLPSTSQLLPEQQRDELASLVSIKTGRPFPEKIPTANDSTGYGLGIIARYSPKETVYFVSGGTLGYRVLAYYFPQEKIFITVALNSASDVNHMDRLIESIYHAVTGTKLNMEEQQEMISFETRATKKELLR